jgi:4-amino-4-deoxy-L-arabinose transferase-like glycosyltransferase
LNRRHLISGWILLLAFCAFFFLWKLAAFGLIGADEPRYAQVAREMLDRGDWVTPTLGGTPWLEKPPLYYWQAMVAYKLGGVSDWSARLPSVFDAFLLVLAMYLLVRRIRPGLQLDAAVVLATTAGVAGFARAASTDMPLTAMFSIAMLAWYVWLEGGQRRYLVAFYFSLALSALAKGPVGPFLAVVIILIFAAVQKSFRLVWQSLWLPGILLFCAVALPWYVLVQLRNPQFFREFILQHNLARFGTNLYHHPEPFWYYVPVTLLGWVPWTVVAVAALITAIRNWRNTSAERWSIFLLIWIAVVVVFFSISRSKLPGYILPAIPAGAILAAEFMAAKTGGESTLWMRAFISGLHAALVVGLLFCSLEVPNLILQHRMMWSPVPLVAAAVLLTAIFIFLLKTNLAGWRIATLAPAIVALALAVRLGAQPLDETLSARPVAAELASVDPHHLPLAVFLVPRETEFGLAFYRNQVISRYELGQVPAGEHLVVAARGFEKSITKETGRTPKYLASFPPQRLEIFYVPAR